MPNEVRVILTIDKTTGEITGSSVEESGMEAREVQIDKDELIKILSGDQGAVNVLAARTGPDPRRLPR
mgnify:CR=1 FL=1